MPIKDATKAVGFLLLLGGAALAGDWHLGQSSHCNDCHLQHSTEDGLPLPGGPYSYLLVKSSINELCLSCHDGSDPTAPDVFHPVEMYSGTVGQGSAAGYFQTTGVYDSHSHTLGEPAVTPLQTAARSVTMTCASCHAVHGNNNHRNLLFDPGEAGDSIIVEEGVQIFVERAPDDPPTAAGSAAAYAQDNVGYKSGLDEWCTGCHDMLRNNPVSVPPAHFNGHPSGVAMDEYIGESHVDAQHWVTGTGEGFDPADGGIQRVRFEAPTATDFVTSKQPDTGNKIFCGSCHKAHGGNYGKTLLWPYQEGSTASNAGCQQCHNK